MINPNFTERIDLEKCLNLISVFNVYNLNVLVQETLSGLAAIEKFEMKGNRKDVDILDIEIRFYKTFANEINLNF